MRFVLEEWVAFLGGHVSAVGQALSATEISFW
jgi:hypothetical protein